MRPRGWDVWDAWNPGKGAAAVARPRVLELAAGVAACVMMGLHGDWAGFDPERPQEAGQCLARQSFALTPKRRPRRVVDLAETINELLGGDLLLVVWPHARQVGQERDAQVVVFVVAGRERPRGLASQRGPVPARSLRYRGERLPAVGGPVVQLLRHIWVGTRQTGQQVRVRSEISGPETSERLAVGDARASPAELLDRLHAKAATHPDDHAAVENCVRPSALVDPGYRRSGEGLELAHVVGAV